MRLLTFFLALLCLLFSFVLFFLLKSYDMQEIRSQTRVTHIVLVGATGDLAKKYLWKGLFELYRKQTQSTEIVKLYGAAREDPSIGQNELQEILESKIKCDSNKNGINCEKWRKEFIESTKYHKLKKSEDYKNFCMGLNAEGASDIEEQGRIFYLSVPPFAYGTISKSIHDYCRPNIAGRKAYLRVVLEKPFGADLESAETLAKELEQYFSDDEIYRVDHYLGKTGVSQILQFRFEHKDKFEQFWNRDHIQSVEIGMKEKDDCKGRTEFYNQYGVICDVMQNHLTEVMALVAMENPSSIDNITEIHQNKLQLFKEIEPLHKYSAIIGQYSDYPKHCEAERGKSDAVDYKTPTFASVLLYLKSSKWKGVPFLMVSGKQLEGRSAYVRIVFKSDFTMKSEDPKSSCSLKQMIFHIQGGNLKSPALVLSKDLPKISKFSNWSPMMSKPDYLYGCRGDSFDIYEPPANPDAYTALIDAMYHGKKELFIGTKDLLASWKVWTPLVNSLKSVLPRVYSRNTLENLNFHIKGQIVEFSRLLGEGVCLSDKTCGTEELIHRYKPSSFRGNSLVTGTRSNVIKKLTKDLLSKALRSILSKGVFHMALSGGSTPMHLFEQLAFFSPEFPWHATHIWFVDERCEAFPHKKSNYNLIYENLLKYTPVPSTNIHPMPVSLQSGLCNSVDKGDEHYEAELKLFLGDGNLDFVLLGVGTDGHTASLFPNSNSLTNQDWVVISESKELAPVGLRMTLTLNILNRASYVAVLMQGEKKADIVQRLSELEDGKVLAELPVTGIRPASGDLIWYIDDKAYANVHK